MSPSDAAAWFAAIIAAAGLIWTGVSQSRERSARAQSEGAERAGRLLELMKGIELGGSDPSLAETTRRGRHDTQLYDLQRLIRLGTADFVTRSLKPPVSKMMLAIVGLYSAGIIVAGIWLLNAGGRSASERLGNLAGGITWLALGAAGLVMFGALLDRRKAHLAQLAAAAAESTQAVLDRYKHQP